jgi:hypothetical protein
MLLLLQTNAAGCAVLQACAFQGFKGALLPLAKADSA